MPWTVWSPRSVPTTRTEIFSSACVLGRTALDQGERDAARAAFQQVLAQAQGRPRTRSCGQLVVQALAGTARANGTFEQVIEGRRLFATRETYNFEPFFGALDEQTRAELAAASHELGRAR